MIYKINILIVLRKWSFINNNKILKEFDTQFFKEKLTLIKTDKKSISDLFAQNDNFLKR